VVTDIQMAELDSIAMMRCIRSVNPNFRGRCTSGATNQYKAVLDGECKEFDARVFC
jgi:hypothetical protein